MASNHTVYNFIKTMNANRIFLLAYWISLSHSAWPVVPLSCISVAILPSTVLTITQSLLVSKRPQLTLFNLLAVSFQIQLLIVNQFPQSSYINVW